MLNVVMDRDWVSTSPKKLPASSHGLGTSSISSSEESEEDDEEEEEEEEEEDDDSLAFLAIIFPPTVGIILPFPGVVAVAAGRDVEEARAADTAVLETAVWAPGLLACGRLIVIAF